MTPFAEIPINSLAWIFGSVACFALLVRSLIVYRRSYSPLTKYICWFAFLITLCLISFGFPSLFTLETKPLHISYIIGEFFMYLAFIPQAAVLWALVLRKYIPIYTITIPVGIVSMATWLYATPNSVLSLRGNFIDYSEPGICSFSMAMLFITMFIPVGYHFMKATFRQSGFKDRLITFVLGMVYAGIGVSTALSLFINGHGTSPQASVGNLFFFTFLFVAIVWPRRVAAKSVLPEIHQPQTLSNTGIR